MNLKYLSTLIVLPLIGCSGNSLLPSQSGSFKVDSAPVGASVLVLGEAMGQTPMLLTTSEVFPHSFDHDKQHLYGRIQLSHPGCEPFITTVSSRIISDGLNARLKCRDANQPQQQTDMSAQPTAAPQMATPIATPQTNTTGLKPRLQQLKELFEEGLISEEDYAAKRRQILEEL